MIVIQHVAPEGPALLAEVARAAGVAVEVVRVDQGAPVPRALPPEASLVVLGGPMAVYEAARHPWMADEQALLRAAVAAGAPVLGICLGSQLLAAAHGAAVRPSGGQELGFHDVTLAADGDALFGGLPQTFAPMHWHGDVFELPRGAVALASSAKTAVQAYRVGDCAWGVLFHPEADAAWVAGCARAFADELRGHGVDPDALAAAAPAGCAAAAPVARAVLERFVDLSLSP
jgi:GMP synthase (glutamine-hydrolysing)